MPLVSMIDLDKSLTSNALFTDSDFDTSVNMESNRNIFDNLITNSNQFSTTNNNLSLHQKLLLRTLNQINNSSINNSTNIKSILLSNNSGSLNNSINNSPNSKQINYSRYKTELCRQFSENGECKYGDKCQFAHGIVDLKDVNRHPKYKTDFCKTFYSKGFCPYGPRCHFIHDINFDTPTKPRTPILINNTTSNISNSLNSNSFLHANMNKKKSRKSTDEDDDDDDDDDPVSDAFQLATSVDHSSNLLSPNEKSSSQSRSRSSTLSSSSSSGISTTSNLTDLNNQFKLNQKTKDDEQLTSLSSINSFDIFFS